MNICKVIIKGFQQFNDFELDLTYPQGHKLEGQPLEKICFIGPNGTGKTILINFFYNLLIDPIQYRNLPFLVLKLKLDNGKFIYSFRSNRLIKPNEQTPPTSFFCSSTIEEQANWINDLYGNYMNIYNYNEYIIEGEEYKDILKELRNKSDDLIIYCPSETNQNLYTQIKDVPQTTLNEALQLFIGFPTNHIVSGETVQNFWKFLIYQIKKRENDYSEYSNRPENQDKSLREVKQEFEKTNPKILEKLSGIWNKILEKAGLEFDFKSAISPIQLTDNLRAYIRLISNHKRVNYNQLSTGIRNFIFKIGHIYSLYFNRQINRGYLLIDEPENSLFPDFLYDLVETYLNITQNTRLIFATHNPIIAAQFEPYERFILDFDDKGFVTARRGETPVGDDPNDILIKDFGIRSILGKEGVENWERYIKLKTLIPLETDNSKKDKLIKEFLRIGSNYNFPKD